MTLWAICVQVYWLWIKISNFCGGILTPPPPLPHSSSRSHDQNSFKFMCLVFISGKLSSVYFCLGGGGWSIKCIHSMPPPPPNIKCIYRYSHGLHAGVKMCVNPYTHVCISVSTLVQHFMNKLLYKSIILQKVHYLSTKLNKWTIVVSFSEYISVLPSNTRKHHYITIFRKDN